MKSRKTHHSPLKKKGYLWATLGLFLLSLTLHWVFGYESFKQEQIEHGQEVIFSDYFSDMMRDTMENWQSEFLQLIWQVAGLSFLWFVGSPDSKEGDERKEEKLDLILKKLDPENYNRIIKQLEDKYPKE